MERNIYGEKIGYFDPADKENGTFFDSYSDVDFTLKAQNILGTIVHKRDKTLLTILRHINPQINCHFPHHLHLSSYKCYALIQKIYQTS